MIKYILELERGNWNNYGNGVAGFRTIESSRNLIKGKAEYVHMNAGNQSGNCESSHLVFVFLHRNRNKTKGYHLRVNRGKDILEIKGNVSVSGWLKR